MFYLRNKKISKEMMKQNIMLSTSTSNSSFLNGESYDRMAILDCETRENYHKPMSKLRKIAFMASIASIVIVIIVFLLLPCNKTCVARRHIMKFTKTINWIQNYENIEFKGQINALKSSNSPQSLIFMYRSEKLFSNYQNTKPKSKSNGGIIKINGNTGEVAWKNEMTNEPRSIDCGLIDSNKNGKNECLVIDDYGQLACIDESGHWIYYNTNSKSTKIYQKHENYDFPIILPDVTGDDVYDIIMASYKGNSTYLSLISGSNGKLLAEEVQNCTYIDKLQLDVDYVVKFICIMKNNTEQQMFKNLTSFYEPIAKKLKTIKLPPISSIPQHKYSDKFSSTNIQVTKVSVLDKELKVENKGTWPESKTTLKLTSLENGIKKTHYNYVGNKAYTFTPVKFSVNISSPKGYQNVHGFIVKLWTWNGTEISCNNENIEKTNREVDKVIKSTKAQRNNFTNQTFNNEYKTKLRFIKETMLMIVFNSTEMKSENTSHSNIVQFCQNSNDSNNQEFMICQPELKYQESSMIITDIDNDGSKELISYYSSFVHEKASASIMNYHRKLKTFVQLFKLETEFPKLYSNEYEIF